MLRRGAIAATEPAIPLGQGLVVDAVGAAALVQVVVDPAAQALLLDVDVLAGAAAGLVIDDLHAAECTARPVREQRALAVAVVAADEHVGVVEVVDAAAAGDAAAVVVDEGPHRGHVGVVRALTRLGADLARRRERLGLRRIREDRV